MVVTRGAAASHHPAGSAPGELVCCCGGAWGEPTRSIIFLLLLVFCPMGARGRTKLLVNMLRWLVGGVGLWLLSVWLCTLEDREKFLFKM